MSDKKVGRPKKETQVSLEEAAVQAGHPLTCAELGDLVQLGGKTINKRIQRHPERWQSTEGPQPRYYPAGRTPYLLSSEEAKVIEALRSART